MSNNGISNGQQTPTKFGKVTDTAGQVDIMAEFDNPVEHDDLDDHGLPEEPSLEDSVDNDSDPLGDFIDEDEDEEVAQVDKVDIVYPNWDDVEVKTVLDPSDVIPSNVFIPGESSIQVQGKFSHSLDLDISNNESTRDWVEILTEAQKVEPRDERFKKTLEQGHWVKDIKIDGESLSHGIQNLQHLSRAKLTGREAKRRAQVYMGGGTYYSAPCWGSGVWIKLNPIGELELLELYREIVSSKISLGRYTYGSVFSSVSGYAIESIVKFIMRNLSKTSVQYDSVEDILEKLKITDLQGILASLNQMLYSSNLQYSTACTADPSKCTHVTVGKLDVSSLIRTNEDVIPTRSRRFMAKTRLMGNVVTSAQLAGYEAELKIKQRSTFDIELPDDKKITIHMKVPSIAEYIRGSHTWIDGIKTMIEEAVIKPKDDEERNKFVSEAALASSLRQYSHFIDYLTFGEELEVHEQEDIEDILITYTSNSTIRTRIVEEVNKFIDDSTITVVGIKAFACPNCGAREGDEKAEIIPLEQLELFIRSLGTKCAEIRRRT